MKQFLKTAATIAFFALTSLSAFASGTLYVYFDPACMDRMEYSDAAGGKFIAYQINTSTSEKIGLVIGTENPNPEAQLPPQTLHCGNTIFDQRFVQSVNQRLTDVYMARPSGDGRYHITKVAYATHFGNSPDLMVYQSPKAQFSFQTNAGIIGENISLNKAVNAVLFEGRIENACTGEYIFSVTSASGTGAFSSLVIAPEIGLVEERSGPNMEEAMRNVLRLDKVNDRPVSEYLRIVCRGERPVPVTSASPLASNQQQLTPRSGETPVPADNTVPPSYDQPSTQQPIAVQPAPASPCAEASGNGFHVVQKGDNLYRISQTYGISVAQLREWNGISAANTIYPCQKLRVAALAQQATPQSYSAEQLTPKTVKVLPAWQVSTGTHTVQPGETVAAIAMKYGYTEYRFRYFNGLSDNEPARVGQALKTTDCETQTFSAAPVQQPKQSTAFENVLTPRTPAVPAENTGAGKIRSVSTVAASATETELTSSSWKTAASSAAAYTPPANMPAPYETSGGRLSSGLSARMQGNETAVPSSYDANSMPAGKRATHLVGKDETLFDIARRYNTTTENLRRLNNLQPGEAIIPGQRLFVN